MQRLKLLLLSCAVCALTLIVQPAMAGTLTDAQKKEVEEIVRELITKKEPELIIRAAQNVQERMDKDATEKGQKAVEKNLDKLVNDPDSPVGGNPKGDVTIIEFFDYSCGYCKVAQPNVEKLLEADKNIRFVYKELPILGPGSVFAAKAALASVAQGKYEKFHEAMMTTKDHLNESSVIDVAKEVGLDTEKLKKDMESDKVKKILEANVELAKVIGARGTPAFIIGGKLYPGAVPFEQMKDAVDAARQAKKK